MRCTLTSCCRARRTSAAVRLPRAAGRSRARIAHPHRLHRCDVLHLLAGLGIERRRRELDEDRRCAAVVDEERRARTDGGDAAGRAAVGGEAAIVSMIRSRRSAAADAVGASSTRSAPFVRGRASLACPVRRATPPPPPPSAHRPPSASTLAAPVKRAIARLPSGGPRRLVDHLHDARRTCLSNASTVEMSLARPQQPRRPSDAWGCHARRGADRRWSARRFRASPPAGRPPRATVRGPIPLRRPHLYALLAVARSIAATDHRAKVAFVRRRPAPRRRR